MYKSKHVQLSILVSIALAASGCKDKQEELRHCVDKDNNVVEDKLCHKTHHSGGIMPFFWMYGGHHSPLGIGSRLNGGTRTPTPGFAPVDRSAALSRGTPISGGNTSSGNVSSTPVAGGFGKTGGSSFSGGS